MAEVAPSAASVADAPMTAKVDLNGTAHPLDRRIDSPVPPNAQAPEATRSAHVWIAVNFAVTTLISAFLLFQVQPLISKYILPWFGGSPGVWTTCILFFQMVLFAGYTYAHVLTRYFSNRGQAIVHMSLLAIAVWITFPTVAPAESWKPVDSSYPALRILLLLAGTVGLPYFVLSTTGPLVQSWFARTWPDRSPYRLYALSNLGSLGALVTYPFVFEPALTLNTQATLWSLAFGLFVLACGVAAIWILRLPQAAAAQISTATIAEAVPAPSLGRRLLWIGLPACASLMLLATTNYVCQDVAVIPLLWVVPLALYLLTFIICFDHTRWYRPVPMAIAATVLIILAAGAAESLQDKLDFTLSFVQELSLYFGTMFVICMVCHGQLVRLRPSANYLTEYYLMISAGGAIGGLFVALVAPQIFTTHFEWTLGLAISLGVSLAVWLPRVAQWSIRRPHMGLRAMATGATACAAFVGTIGGVHWLREGAQGSTSAIYRGRNFYGTVTVLETFRDDPELHHRTFVSGSTRHGRQFCAPEKRKIPISYFAEHTGVARSVRYFQNKPNERVGVIGMGVGVMAAYSRPGDYYRFYEINQQVVDLAKKYFTFLDDCEAKYDVVVADARLALERELAAGDKQQFDVLAIDAFTGDAPPMHLLTAEAFALYLEHLKPDGVIVVNITNRYIDFAPVLKGLAEHYDMGMTRIMTPLDKEKLQYRTDFAVLTRNKEFLAATPPVLMKEFVQPDRDISLWTDQYSNLFSLLKR